MKYLTKIPKIICNVLLSIVVLSVLEFTIAKNKLSSLVLFFAEFNIMNTLIKMYSYDFAIFARMNVIVFGIVFVLISAVSLVVMTIVKIILFHETDELIEKGSAFNDFCERL